MTGTIPCPVHVNAVRDPDRVALADRKSRLTYRQLGRLIDTAAAGLRSRGVGDGDIVAVLGRNSLSYAVLFLAAFRAGFVLMPLNTRLTVSEWRRQIGAAGGRLLVCGRDFERDATDIADSLVPMDELVAVPSPDHKTETIVEIPLDRDALVIHSSGTTGSPRAVVLTRANLYFNALGVSSALGYGRDDCWLAVLPFFHVGGISILFRMMLAGGTVHIPDRFDPDEIIALAEGGQISLLSVVPTMLHELLSCDTGGHLKNLKAVILGGAACDETLRREILARDVTVLTTYGLTETASMMTLLPLDARRRKLSTAGVVLPHREIRIADETGPRPPGQPGCIHARGRVLFSRYLNRRQRYVDAEGWFDTGDIGLRDEDGYLSILGRADNVIVSGGENIDLDRIERDLAALDGISGVVVLPRPDRKWGARPVAFVAVDDDSLTDSRIRDMLATHLPRFMIPDRIVIVDRLPVTGSGKYDRQALRDRFHELLSGEN